MLLLSSLLFGVSASLDTLLVGISMGLRHTRVHLWQNLVISVITLLGTCLSIWLGAWLLPFLPAVAGEIIGCIILLLFGFYYLGKSVLSRLKKRRSGNALEDTDTFVRIESASPLSLPEICLLGIALSTNNAGIGLSASMAGLSFFPTALATFLCSVLFLALGVLLGNCRFLSLTDAFADFLSGLLILCLGVASYLF